MRPTLQLRIGQHLTMTPQLQQAIKLLQLSTLDLQQEIQEALESNPLLEVDESIQNTDQKSENNLEEAFSADVTQEISVSDGKLSNGLNLNFKSNIGTNFETMSRIASADMAAGNIPEHATIVVDIDVYTGEGFSVRDADSVKKWIIEAHDKEKESFFSVLGKEATERLRED